VFGIGEFSKLCHVTTKTLRHYDLLGLIKPASVNSDTGYRYYDAKQLAQVMMVVKLRITVFRWKR
jgi:DNA-binding transcriptional MerR regulator